MVTPNQKSFTSVFLGIYTSVRTQNEPSIPLCDVTYQRIQQSDRRGPLEPEHGNR